ncbi:MAG TPA: trehalose-phosphatase [Acidimicrobiales bacterium]|nr:trehalose-phosphatase [Acidimicrobiales bacterium]
MMNGSPTEVVARVARAPSLLVVCEFDGGIAEFVNDPATARPVEGAIDVLATIGSLPRTRAAVISGRSLESLSAVCTTDQDDARQRGIELIGSDGMEMASHLTLGLTAAARRTQRTLLREAALIADAHPGVTIDAKPYGVALNVRGAATIDGRHATEQMLDIVRSMPLPVYSQARSQVLDVSVLPVAQDWAIDALRQATAATVFYAGNDQRALASLRSADGRCSIGVACTDATVRVASPAALVALLAGLCRERACVLDKG